MALRSLNKTKNIQKKWHEKNQGKKNALVLPVQFL
jgi:hypothetical protein